MPRVHYDAVLVFVVVYFVLFWWFGGCTIGYFFIHLIANMLFFVDLMIYLEILFLVLFFY